MNSGEISLYMNSNPLEIIIIKNALVIKIARKLLTKLWGILMLATVGGFINY